MELTPELTTELCGYLHTGNYLETACALVGVRTTTVYRWLRKAKDIDENVPLAEQTHDQMVLCWFRACVLRAQAFAEQHDLALMESIAREKGDWRAYAWRLERRHPSRYALRQVVQLANSQEQLTEGTEAYDLRKLDDTQLAELEALLSAAQNTATTEADDRPSNP